MNETIVEVPIFITRVSCGQSIPCGDGIEYVDIPTFFLQGVIQPLIVEVSGNSMEPFFYQNELLLIDIEDTPCNRDIVLIYLNGSYFLKRLEFADGKVTLASANYLYPKIILQDCDEWRIIGVFKRKIDKKVLSKNASRNL